MLAGRLTAPPRECYTLHRKLSGAFLSCIKLEAKVSCKVGPVPLPCCCCYDAWLPLCMLHLVESLSKNKHRACLRSNTPSWKPVAVPAFSAEAVRGVAHRESCRSPQCLVISHLGSTPGVRQGRGEVRYDTFESSTVVQLSHERKIN